MLFCCKSIPNRLLPRAATSRADWVTVGGIGQGEIDRPKNVRGGLPPLPSQSPVPWVLDRSACRVPKSAPPPPAHAAPAPDSHKPRIAPAVRETTENFMI